MAFGILHKKKKIMLNQIQTNKSFLNTKKKKIQFLSSNDKKNLTGGGLNWNSRIVVYFKAPKVINKCSQESSYIINATFYGRK